MGTIFKLDACCEQNVSRHHQPEVCLFNDTPPAPVALQAAESIRSFFTLHHPGWVESGRLIGCCRLAEDSLALCLERSPARRPKDRRSPSVLFNKKGAPLFLPSAAAPLKAESLGASHQHPAPLLRNPLLQKLVFYQNPSHFNFLFFAA